MEEFELKMGDFITGPNEEIFFGGKIAKTKKNTDF